MKSIKELIQENLINESRYKSVILAFYYERPENDFIIIDPTKKQLEYIEDREFEFETLMNPTNIVYIRHSDESPEIWNVAQTESQMKSDAIKAIKSSLDQFETERQNDSEHADDVEWWADWEFEGWWGVLNMSPLKFDTPEKVYKEILEYIKESYIDGDSARVCGVVDISKKKELFGGDHYIDVYDGDSYNDYLKELAQDDEWDEKKIDKYIDL